jgi:hypothetical protein
LSDDHFSHHQPHLRPMGTHAPWASVRVT